jgi:hypothetical protein
MTTRTLVVLSSATEMATGLALIALPGLVARALLGADLSAPGIAVARVAGLGLPGQHDITPHTIRALFIYNLLAALYLGYLRVGGGFVSYLLWPACVLHAVLTILFAVQNRRGVRPGYLG